MSYKPQSAKVLFLVAFSVYFYRFQLCGSVSLVRAEDGWSSHRADASAQSGRGRPEPGAYPVRVSGPPDFASPPATVRVSLNTSAWTGGSVRATWRPPAPDSEDGYQADSTGFSEVRGKIVGLSLASSPHFLMWEAMRPLLLCESDGMTLTASGEGFVHLQVDRKGDSPVSIFQLPSDCGFSVKASWSHLEMMVHYYACYILQENGSYVLPMLWLGSPLKLSCPVTSTTAASFYPLAAPSVFCSAFGMAVQIQGQEHSLPMLGVVVNGAQNPFVSERCAYQVDSEPQEFTFIISHNAPCITTEDGLQLQLVLDDEQYILSCPVVPQSPYDLFSFSDPASSFPQTPGNQNPQLPSYPHYPDAGFQIQSSFSPHISVDPSTGSQLQAQYPAGTGGLSYSLASHLQYFAPHIPPMKDSFPHPVSKFPDHLPLYPYALHHPLPPFYYVQPSKHPAALHAPKLFHPSPAAAPATQAPPFIPKEPQTGPLLKPALDRFLQQIFSSAFRATAAPPVSPTSQCSGSPANPPDKFSVQTPSCPQLPPSNPAVGQHPQFPLEHIVYPPYLQRPQHPYPDVQPPVSTPPTSLPQFPPESPSLRCLQGRMTAFLPFADAESIQVRGKLDTWEPLSSVSPLCGYQLQMAAGYGAFFYSPQPACHSQIKTPTLIALHLKYWDFSIRRNKTLELLCPFQADHKGSYMSPTPPTSTKGKSSRAVSRTEVFCTAQQMRVVLPHGPVSEIQLIDSKGNQMSLVEAPEECGYDTSEAKDGSIHLTLKLHSRCHMSVQDGMYIIGVIYMTETGRKDSQFSCPVQISRSEHECNLQSEYRLPCGSSSMSQTQCLSMGCCFNKHPPTCYYPMDECTIDRHMIFSVPASLTDPPLSPALLVAANNSTCKPQRATSEYALFNIPMDGCGTRRAMVGETLIYMVEIINVVQTVSLNYGTITRDSPVRLLVECRYVPGTPLSVGYVVKTPTFGAEVHTQGVFGVQLRIAKDAQYSSYYPQYHQPLHMLLGKPLYLEVRLLNSPDPSLVLLVHYCVAYPRSGTAVWVLLYNGCPNPLDPAPPKTALSDPTPPSPQSQTRRFSIRTFQFLPDGEFKDMEEEVYFMCSTEICSPQDGPCVEGCFAH